MLKETVFYLFILLCLLVNRIESFSLFDQRPFTALKKSRKQIRKEHGGLPEAHELSTKEKQDYIKQAFVFSWQGYKNYSWGFDENRPNKNKPRNTR
jgi:mannosyl-oligosaccharide alpha-1,2-mannosidase